MSNQNIAIGIDLGTVNSVLAIHKNDKTELIQCQNLRITPSFVFYDLENDNVYVGDPTDSKVWKNPANAIYDTKRLIGRSFDDENVQKILKNYFFEIKPSATKEIHIPIKQMGKTLYKTPQEISSEILKSFKKTASNYLGQDVTEAVITVPAYFNYSQRFATKQAAELAGLKVLKLLNEPSAAFLYYTISKKIKNDSIYLVFDLGGGTLDISIVKYVDENIKTLNVDGDTFLGGRNFDEALLNNIIKTRKLVLTTKQKRRLMSRIEEAKKKISYRDSYSITIHDFFGEDDDLEVHITRSEFENINVNYFKKCRDLIDRSLQTVGLKKQDIDKIILVGGSSKIPKIKEIIREYFEGKEVLTDVDPDEAVALGATIHAATMKGLTKHSLKMNYVTPFSLGVDIYGGKMKVLIQKNTPIPAKMTCGILTADNNQSGMALEIYEGERSRCILNNHIGRISLKNLPLRPARHVKVSITFSVNENGLLTVTASEESSGEKTTLDIGVELYNFKSKYEISLVNETELDDLFIKFVDLKENIRIICVTFTEDKFKNEPVDVEKCKQFISKIDALEFEDRSEFKKLLESFEGEVNNKKLIGNIDYVYKVSFNFFLGKIKAGGTKFPAPLMHTTAVVWIPFSTLVIAPNCFFLC